MFQSQSFQTGDIASVAALVLLEALLSADNALVLAIMVRHLPRKLQQRALLYGLGGAFAFRLIAILLAGLVLQLWWLQALGALYLLFLPIKHFTQHSQNKDVKPVGAGFWPTVIAVEITDVAFAIDSVLAGVAFINNNQSKIWVVYVGAIIGIVLLRFAAAVFIRLLEKYPMLDHVAYVLVGWVGVKLSFLAAKSYERSHPGTSGVPMMPSWLFWAGLLGIAIIGTFIAIRNPNTAPTELDDEALVAEDVADMTIDDPRE